MYVTMTGDTYICISSECRPEEIACQSAPEGDADTSALPRASSHRSLHSQASSGLSESSDTLTDVSSWTFCAVKI